MIRDAYQSIAPTKVCKMLHCILRQPKFHRRRTIHHVTINCEFDQNSFSFPEFLCPVNQLICFFSPLRHFEKTSECSCFGRNLFWRTTTA